MRPNFLIIGAAKAATTSLYHYLRQHPDVYMSPVKEPAYFARDRAVVKTLADYERLFDGATAERALGEASPQYLNDPDAPVRIATDLPQVRLIVSLRNPVDRAYSSYLGRLTGGTERQSVDEALREGSYYVESSFYRAPLARWIEQFGRERIAVILFDDMQRDPRAVLRQLCLFLDIDPAFPFDLGVAHGAATAPRATRLNAAFVRIVEGLRKVLLVRNTGVAGRIHRLLLRRPPPLPPEIRERLRVLFREDILATAALIGRDLAHWL